MLVVLVVSHQDSVHVTFGVVRVVKLSDFRWQVACARVVEVADGVVGVLVLIPDHWEKISSILEPMKAILSSDGITQCQLVVVQAAADVPTQQPETVARRRATKATVFQRLFRVQRLSSRGQSEQPHEQIQLEVHPSAEQQHSEEQKRSIINMLDHHEHASLGSDSPHHRTLEAPLKVWGPSVDLVQWR